MEKRRPGRPPGSKNKPKSDAEKRKPAGRKRADHKPAGRQKTGRYKPDIETIHPECLPLDDEKINQIYNRCETIIQDTCIECNYDIQNIKANNWTYILYIIYNQLFKVYPELYKDYSNPYNNIPFTYQRDNIYILYDRIYYPLCNKYSQIISIYNFCRLLDIDIQTIQQWSKYNNYSGYSNDKVRYRNTKLYQRIMIDRESSLRQAMLSSTHNPVKFLAIGNHEFNWNESQKQDIPDEKQVISIDDIPKLELTDNSMLIDSDDIE